MKVPFGMVMRPRWAQCLVVKKTLEVAVVLLEQAGG